MTDAPVEREQGRGRRDGVGDAPRQREALHVRVPKSATASPTFRPFSKTLSKNGVRVSCNGVEAAHRVQVDGERHEAERERLENVGRHRRVVRVELVTDDHAEHRLREDANSTDAGSISTTM